MSSKSRREFLILAAGAGGLAALGWRQLFKRDASARGASRLSPKALSEAGWVSVKKSAHAFGTKVSIQALHRDSVVAQRAVEAAFRELGLVEELMTIYRPQSPLRRLNRDGVLEHPHPYLVEVLRKARAFSEQSGGAFDVTVQPLWECYAAAKKRGTLPAPGRVGAARKKVDWRKVEVRRERVRLMEPGMAVTLNGIAQGYAADRALSALRESGVTHALVNSGEIGSLGRKPENNGREDPWKVGIQHPRVADAFLALAQLQGGCLATSGDYATSFTPDRAYNHIFDPATGRSPEAFSSVSVLSPRGVDADALSTAVFVAGLERGRKLIASVPGSEALFVRKDGTTLATQGFPKAS